MELSLSMRNQWQAHLQLGCLRGERNFDLFSQIILSINTDKF